MPCHTVINRILPSNLFLRAELFNAYGAIEDFRIFLNSCEILMFESIMDIYLRGNINRT
jgi:hypothetical protein